MSEYRKKDCDFAHLHVHSDLSAFDGIGSPAAFAERAAELGQSAISFTEHGTVRGLWDSAKACAETGVKFVPGCEFYLADDAEQKGLTDAERADLKTRYPDPAQRKEIRKRIDARLRERDHITVWALTDRGLRNLTRLVSWAWTKGFYYKPRIDLEILRAHADGLAASGGCVGTGVVVSPIRAGRFSEALNRAEQLHEILGGRLVIEVMPHILEGVGVASQLLAIADRLQVPAIATQDAHYPLREHATAQDVLLCIQTRSKIADPDRFRLPSHDYWLRSRDEMAAAYAAGMPEIPRRTVDRMLDATVEFAARCITAVPEPRQGAYLVAPDLPDGMRSHDAWLIDLCETGVRSRYGEGLESIGDEIRLRLLHELRTITRLGFAPYFLAVYDVVSWARAAGILVGPGRGSAAGCLVSYLLGITDLDPLRYGLSFERFLAPGRVDLPDIDLDFESVRRDEVLDHLRSEYGEGHVAHISTTNRLGGRSTLRDLARIYGLPEREISPLIGKLAEYKEVGTVKVAPLLDGTLEGREFATLHPEIAEVIPVLEGNLRSVGLHAAGVVLSSEPLVDIVPVESRARGGGARIPAVAYDMHGVEGAGLVKLDILGLRALTTIRIALDLAGADLADLDVEDPRIYAGFSRGEFGGVFQYDTPAARRLCHGVEFAGLSDVAVMTALNRPGPAQSGLASLYVDRRTGRAEIDDPDPVWREVFRDTFGVPIYQEQIVELVKRLCGYTPETADAFRKKVSKKTGLSDEEDAFIDGAVEHSGLDPEAARRMFSRIVGFARYAFNRAHAYSYGMLAVWCMWLRIEHPAEYFAACLTTEPDPDKRIALAGEARRLGLPIVPPDVQGSSETFQARRTDDTVEIVGSLIDVTQVGPVAARVIVDGAPYADLADFYRRAGTQRGVTVRTFETLARAGALRSLCHNARFLVVNAKAIWGLLKRDVVPVVALDFPDYSPDERAAMIGSVWPPYLDTAGARELEVVEERIRSLAKREIVPISSLYDPAVSSGVVVGRVRDRRIYQDEDGQTARLTLAAPDGSEITARADSDVVEAYLADIEPRAVVIALVSRTTYGARVEAVWPASAALDGQAMLEEVLAAHRTKPRDPGRSVASARPGDHRSIEGIVVRVRRYFDKSGGRMARVGLLGSHGFVQFFVFASRYYASDVKRLEIGEHVAVRLERLDGGGACLSSGEVSTLKGLRT